MDGWILVYSVDNDRSFSVIKEIYEKLAVSVQSPPLVVVGNKTDLGAAREVSEKAGRALASDIGAMYVGIGRTRFASSAQLSCRTLHQCV